MDEEEYLQRLKALENKIYNISGRLERATSFMFWLYLIVVIASGLGYFFLSKSVMGLVIAGVDAIVIYVVFELFKSYTGFDDSSIFSNAYRRK